MENQPEGGQEAPEILQPEDEQFLKDLEAQGLELKGRERAETPTEPVQPKDAPVEEAPKPDEKLEEKPKPEEEKPERQPKFVEAWRMKVAEKKWGEREKELLSELESLKTKTVEKTPESVAGIKELAQKYAVSEELLQDLAGTIKNTIQIPADLEQQLADIRREKQAQTEAKEFDREFREKILPNVQKEFPNATAAEIEQIRAKVQQYAYSPAYLKTPLDLIYKGIDDFRASVPNERRPIEDSRGRGTGKVLDYDKLTEEEFAKMDREEQAKYFAYVDSKGLAR